MASYVICLDTCGNAAKLAELCKLAELGGVQVVDGWPTVLRALAQTPDRFLPDDQLYVLSDECLLFRRLSAWGGTLQARQIDIAGVRKPTNNTLVFDRTVLPYLAEMGVPAQYRNCPAATLDPVCIWMSGRFIRKLAESGVLRMVAAYPWPLPSVELFLSWAAQVVGAIQLEWGTHRRSLMPLYVTSCGHAKVLPHPAALHTSFALLSPIVSVAGVSDQDLYEFARQALGAPATRTLETVRPVVTDWASPAV